MSRPTARVLALLEILQAGGVHPVADIAERLGVDARTVRRYVDHLADLDVPVESVRGRYGGYRLARGYRIPPLMLTDDEALATLLGLMTVRRAGLAATPATAADIAAAKLRRVLPRPLGRRLEALLAMTEFTTASEDAGTGPGGRILLSLAEAAWDRHQVRIHYCTRDGRRSQRVLHPYGLVAHSGRWYVTGADTAGGEIRTFRADRIDHLEVLPGSFDEPAGFDARAQVLDGLARNPWTYDVRLRVQATRARIRSQFPEGIAVLDDTPPASHTPVRPEDGAEPAPRESWVRVRLRAERLDWIPPLLAALDRPFVIEQPSQLRDLVSDFAQRLARFASPQDSR
ncbi:YafY family protein [Streptomyces sp. NPDC046197]|uniref:helix-turn-helix transcriptional regulator n=1 Tax=Streptomyces sp. NPDC046197 TaxID=3154337 RepID=UPI0034077049